MLVLLGLYFVGPWGGVWWWEPPSEGHSVMLAEGPGSEALPGSVFDALIALLLGEMHAMMGLVLACSQSGGPSESGQARHQVH